MKKILIINPGPKYNVVYQFQERLETLSAEFAGTLVTTSDESVDSMVGHFRVRAFKIHYPIKQLNNILYYVAILAFLLKERLKGQAYDLVITYDPLKTGLMGVVAKYIFSAKFAPEVNGDYASEENYADTASKFQRAFKFKLFKTVMGIVLKRANGVKLLFPSQIDYYKSRLKIADKIVRVIPSYIKVEKFENHGDQNIILFTGFPMYRKGLDILIKAFAQVAGQHPDWQLKILGWYPDQESLDNMINGHPQIFHHGAVMHDEMPTHIGQCGVFVLPSRSEAMGRVLIEAMAAGKARIGANVGGIPTVINDGVDGLLFESENVEQLASLLDKVMGDAELRRALGDKGYARAREEFQINAINKRFMQFYHDILQA